MPAPGSKFALLLKLAREPSSDGRRELLRQIASMLSGDSDLRTNENCAAFDEIAAAVTADLKSEARSEVSRLVAQSALPLGRTARQLAMDEIAVAGPVLEHSEALSDRDLVDVAETQSQEHLMAVTRRSRIGEIVSDALVRRGEDRVVVSLLGNKGAEIGRETFEKVAVRAQTSSLLQAPFVHRQGVPLDLLNDVYAKVANELKQEILQHYEDVSPAELEAALQRSRTRVAKAYGGLPQDLESARLQLRKLEYAGHLKPPVLVRLMREGPPSRTLFLLALAKLTDTDYPVAQRLVDSRDVDGIALLCRAAGFERPLFVALSLGLASDGNRADLEEFGRLYEQVPEAAAQRAVRFWKVRAAV
jgi:uncharacterized protein (DUF2336 family)